MDQYTTHPEYPKFDCDDTWSVVSIASALEEIEENIKYSRDTLQQIVDSLIKQKIWPANMDLHFTTYVEFALKHFDTAAQELGNIKKPSALK